MIITDTVLLMIAIGATAWIAGMVTSCALEANVTPFWVCEILKFLNGFAIILTIVAWIGWIL